MDVERDVVGVLLDDRIRAALTEAENDPRLQTALDELRGLIRAAYPTATFVIAHGYEPPGIRLIVTLDIDELDDAMDVFIPRLVDMQVEEGLPVYVVLGQPLERVVAELRGRQDGAAVSQAVSAG